MPLYLFEAPTMTDGQRREALRLCALRFPEVALEQGFAHHDGDGHDVWLCRAPNRDRLSRWAAALGLRVQAIRHVDPVRLRPETRTTSKERSHEHCR
jgi:hypothetical protein